MGTRCTSTPRTITQNSTPRERNSVTRSKPAAKRSALVTGMLMNGGGDAIWSGKPLKVWVTDGRRGSGRVLFTLQVSAIEDR